MAKPAKKSGADFDRQNEAAVREAREADRIEPRATAIRYDSQAGLLLIELRSGFVFGFPPERVPGLEDATSRELSEARLSPSGDGMHWDQLNVDASLTGLMANALNLAEWAPRFMGQARSEAKARASRLNGLKGGRPKRATTKAPTRSKKSKRS